MRELMDRVDSHDFTLYQAYDRLDPFGNERFDLIGGIICDTLAKLKRVKNTKPGDFMVDWGAEPKKRKTPKQMYNMFKMFCASTGGKVLEAVKKKE